jgi:hypothetical protein
LLRGLHEAQEKPDAEILLASALTAGGWERTYVEHENVPHKIFGGYVAHRAYMYAHICSEMVASVHRQDFNHRRDIDYADQPGSQEHCAKQCLHVYIRECGSRTAADAGSANLPDYVCGRCAVPGWISPAPGASCATNT